MAPTGETLSIEMVHRDTTRLAEKVTLLTGEIGSIHTILQEMKLERAVRQEREIHLNERLGRIEDSINRQGKAFEEQGEQTEKLFGKVTKAG